MEGIEINVAPMSGRQKVEMTSLYTQDEKGRFRVDKPAQEHFMIKHSIKGINGLKDADENDYTLEFDGEYLTDACADELLSFLVNTWFTVANTQAISGLYGQVINPMNQKPVIGVSIERVIKEGEAEGKP